ncbi:MAG: mechanosensitive ion channel family protein [Puniceicoccales bacterium]
MKVPIYAFALMLISVFTVWGQNEREGEKSGRQEEVSATTADPSPGRGKLSEGLFESARNAPPLYIPSASSPQETLSNFFELTEGIRDIFLEGTGYGDVGSEQEEELIDLYTKLKQLLDTSELPEVDAYARENIIVSQISEVLNRIAVPPIEDIPDAEEVTAKQLKFWRIPNTEISLSLIEEGPRKGDWVVSSDTVGKAEELYERAEEMPYRQDAAVGLIGEGGGLLDHYINYTGPLIPVDLTNHIPEWMRVKILGDPLWKYFGSLFVLGILGAIFLLVRLLTRFRGDRESRNSTIVVHLRRLILPVLMACLLPVTVHLITIDVRLRLIPLDVVDDILWVLAYINAFWLCVCVGSLVSAMIIRSPRISPFGLDASLVRLCARLVAYFVGFYIVFIGFKDLGISLVPMIAGVSVGGLAIALAAKPTLGNILGGALIFADKPFVIGDRCVINHHDGIIEEIGLRSTRIRTLDGHQITIPNEEVANAFVENIGRRPYIKRVLNLTLTYSTPPEKIKTAIEITRRLVSIEEDGGLSEEKLGRPSNSHINSEDFPPRVYFNDLNPDSLNLLVIFWYTPPDYFEYLDYCTWFNIQLLERFQAAGIDFAFPTQTVEIKRSESASLPLDRGSPASVGEHKGLYQTAAPKNVEAAGKETPEETIERLANSPDDESTQEAELKEAIEKKAAQEGGKS